MTIQERVLLWRIRRDPAAVFDGIYAEYGQRVYRFCRRLCANAADAEDLAQEVFVAAFGGLERFEGRSSIVTWLYRIAVLRHRTLIIRRPPTPLNFADSEHLSTPDTSASHLAQMDLAAALADLPDAHRNAFLLVKAEGFTCREASEVLDVPEGTVKYHVHEAVAALRRQLSRDLSYSGGSMPHTIPASTSTPRKTDGDTAQGSMCYELH